MKLLLAAIATFITVQVQAQHYQPVNDKSSVKFVIKNFGVNTGGDFGDLQGSIVFDPANAAAGSFEVSVDAATVNTNIESRDNHLRKEEYFDVANHPRLTFKSGRIEPARKGSYVVFGKLGIKGIEKDISIPFTAQAKDDGLLFEGSFKINRKDFKVGGNSLVLGDEVTISLSVFARKQ